jgi:MarR family transcriptional regulator, lower aerobic nicotinate degradation pathway regulator
MTTVARRQPDRRWFADPSPESVPVSGKPPGARARMPVFPQLLNRRPGLILTEAAAACAALMDLALQIAGLRSREYAILALLEAARAPMAHVTISYRLQRDRTTVARAVAELERKGMVNRDRDPEDRRMDSVAMTPRGADALYGAHNQLDAADLEFFGSLGADERRSLYILLSRLGAAIAIED